MSNIDSDISTKKFLDSPYMWSCILVFSIFFSQTWLFNKAVVGNIEFFLFNIICQARSSSLLSMLTISILFSIIFILAIDIFSGSCKIKNDVQRYALQKNFSYINKRIIYYNLSWAITISSLAILAYILCTCAINKLIAFSILEFFFFVLSIIFIFNVNKD